MLAAASATPRTASRRAAQRADHSALAHLGAPDLELRLHQGHDLRRVGRHRTTAGRILSRDEDTSTVARVGRSGNARDPGARVHALPHHDAGILAETRVELPVADVDRVDAARAPPSRQSVNPPVDAPTSRQTRPSTRTRRSRARPPASLPRARRRAPRRPARRRRRGRPAGPPSPAPHRGAALVPRESAARPRPGSPRDPAPPGARRDEAARPRAVPAALMRRSAGARRRAGRRASRRPPPRRRAAPPARCPMAGPAPRRRRPGGA